MKFTPGGKQVAHFRMAVDRTRSKSKTDKETDFFPIVAWDRLAEICGQYLTKGQLILVEGRMQIRQYEVEGQKRTAFDVVASEMQMLGGKPQSSQGGRSDSYDAPPKRHADEGMEAEDMGIEDIPF